MDLAYRIAQFFQALTANPERDTLARAETCLEPPLRVLFRSMNPADQAHSLGVFESLMAAGLKDPDLLAAALLHDVGKSLARPRLWERVLIVLADRFFPEAKRRWGIGKASGWRRPFVIARQHPQWGSAIVEQAGGSSDLVKLIKHHHQPPQAETSPKYRQLWRALNYADERN